MEFLNIKNKITKGYIASGSKQEEAIKNANGFDYYSSKYTMLIDAEGKKGISIDATLTKKQQSKSIEEQKALLIAKVTKYFDKKINEVLAELEEVENADDIDFIKINVDWTKSVTWGMNPRAELSNGREWIEGTSVGGCGYDKESTATAQVLNQSKSVKKLLFKKYDDFLQNTPEDKQQRQFLKYGVSAYDLPYFSGGVGVGCHINNLEELGFELTASNNSKYNNFYYFNKKAEA